MFNRKLHQLDLLKAMGRPKGTNLPRSAAEKQRRYRARRDADPERREKYLEKEREKYREDLKSGRKKRINNLSEREKRRQRKKWRETYHRIKDRKEALQHLITPSHSPQLSPAQAVDPQPSTSRCSL
ncbi:E3 ubiquitin-protein ligase BRE1A-like [Trichomycterus rosablanca]|uniref:E3 ubiquitin-protein ligase BRE1A-like n=1 Tax=Trichomycterus rosablanca TaxID=2290929 RepID=UPI002F3545E2